MCPATKIRYDISGEKSGKRKEYFKRAVRLKNGLKVNENARAKRIMCNFSRRTELVTPSNESN